MEQTQSTDNKSVASKATNSATEANQKVKSYTERFLDMENMISRISYAMNFQAKTIEELLKRINLMGEELERLNMVRKSVNAIMKISESGITEAGAFSLEKVADKVEQLEVQATKDQLSKDLADGVMKKSDTIDNDLTVFEFKYVPDGGYGIASVGTVNPELKTSLIGKKVGDVVKNVEITGIYSYNLETNKNIDEGKNEKKTTNESAAGQ